MIFIKKTLAERVRDFSVVKTGKSLVKVPKLKLRKEKPIRILKQKKGDKTPISSIVSILIKSAVEKAKREKKEKGAVEESKSYALLKDEKALAVNSGYGTVSTSYGSTHHASYVDYGKLFGYLGNFKAQSAYENIGNGHATKINKLLDEGGKFFLIDKETMETGARYVKYFIPTVTGLDTTSLVPVAGMSSAEWEQFKLWMKLDPVMYRLKTSTS